MADTAAHLVDRVVPDVPVRQWVLTFPFPLRRLLAYDGKLMSAVLACFVRAVTRHYQRRHGPAARTGAVAVIQRFGSALNLNPHIHAGLLGGVYVRPAPGRPLKFHPAPPLTDADLESVMADFRTRPAGRTAASPEGPGPRTRPTAIPSRPARSVRGATATASLSAAAAAAASTSRRPP
jgi:hypothetical protein